MWNDVVVGAVLALAALIRLAAPRRTGFVRIGCVLLGGWLVLAPAVLGYVDGVAPRATANDVIVGALTALLSLASLVATGLVATGSAPGGDKVS